MYSRNTAKQDWMSETRLYLFGPSETQIATDPTLREAIRAVLDEGTIPVACKYCSDKYAVTGLLEELGCEVAYVGEPISRAIRDGFVPMVW